MKIPKNAMSLVVLAAMSVAGCRTSAGPIGTDPSVTVTDLAELPTPSILAGSDGGYVEAAGPLDVLSIQVYGVEELSREVRVGGSGYIDYPLIGPIFASGRSTSDIAEEIEEKLGRGYVRDPDIQVNYLSREGQVFTIGGEVQSPGQYPILQRLTLLEAIAIGEGAVEFTDFSEVMIFREVEGQRYIGVYDVTAIQRGNYPDPEIYPHDLVMVSELPNTRLLQRLQLLVPLITSPLILIERATR